MMLGDNRAAVRDVMHSTPPGRATNPVDVAKEATPWGSALFEQHRHLLERSAIDAEVAQERGYRSADTKASLKRLGFGNVQANPPNLVIPLHTVAGEPGGYQFRPDEPRVKGGKAIKYETPRDQRMVLDVPPRVRHNLADPNIPLFITEGARKADAAVSAGLTCISLAGVWSWRGTNATGGKTALADFEAIALNGRTVYLVFDSDVVTKVKVYKALARLKAYLESRGALVFVVYLPAGPGAAKVGLDDFLAAGHTVDDLLALASTDLRAPSDADDPDHPYRSTAAGLVWLKASSDGVVPTSLTNFDARVVGDVFVDDGSGERRRYVEIAATLAGREARFTVPAEHFGAVDRWACEHLGIRAMVYPGQSIRDHARAAIQSLSVDVDERHVFAHTGWREIDGVACYLHAGGALGPMGRVDGVAVELNGNLALLSLPDPRSGNELVNAVKGSLALLDLAPDAVMVPLLGATYRAPLGEADFAVALVGPTGAGKTEAAARAQQHFGPELDARRLPGSWTSTANALEELAFAAKDALVFIDDFAPAGTAADRQRLHGAAERVFRGVGNHAGRQRMRADCTLRPERPPRALVGSTGEDAPAGHSIRARIAVVEVGPDDVDFKALSIAQQRGEAGAYAAAMSGYLQWLAADYDAWRADKPARLAELRSAAATAGAHRRTPSIVANLALGWGKFLDFAVAVGAIDVDERDVLWRRVWAALGALAAAQAAGHDDVEPTQVFLRHLAAAVASGQAHVSDKVGNAPANAPAWGWRLKVFAEHDDWQPQGKRIGWVDDDALYLEPDASFAVASEVIRDQPLAIAPKTLHKRLDERGLLRTTEPARHTLSVRKKLEGKRRSVLHLAADVLSADAGPDQPDHRLWAYEAGNDGGQLAPTSCDRLVGRDGVVPTTEHVAPPAPAAQRVGLVGSDDPRQETGDSAPDAPLPLWSEPADVPDQTSTATHKSSTSGACDDNRDVNSSKAAAPGANGSQRKVVEL